MLPARVLLMLALVMAAGCNSAEPPTPPDAIPVAPGTPNPDGMGTSTNFVL